MSPHFASGTRPPVGTERAAPAAEPSSGDKTRVEPGDCADQREQRRRDLAEATQQLLQRARSVPDPESSRLRDQAVTDYLWLADAIAQRYRGRGEEHDDLVQIARTGLVEAAQRYEARCGSFPGFASPTISGVLKRHFRDRGWLVRPPRATQEAATQVNRMWPQVAQELGAEPDDRAMAAHIGLPLDVVRRARFAGGGYAACSLDGAVNARSVVADASSDQDLLEDRLLVASVWRQISTNERRLLILRFFEDRSQSDIAAEIGTSQMQVSRMLSRTFRKMRRLIAGSDESRSPVVMLTS